MVSLVVNNEKKCQSIIFIKMKQDKNKKGDTFCCSPLSFISLHFLIKKFIQTKTKFFS